MPTPDSELKAIQQLMALVTAQMKSQSETLVEHRRTTEKIFEKLDDMSGRMIRIEEADHKHQFEVVNTKIDALSKRVSDLEALRSQGQGAVTLLKIAKEWAPLIASLLFGWWLYVTKK